MTTTAKRAEAREASLIFHAALIAYGLDTVVDTLSLYQNVNPSPSRVQATLEVWFRATRNLVGLRQTGARDLAFAYYRYHRALHTGATLPPLPGEDEDEPSLATLRDDFFRQVREQAPGVVTDDGSLVDTDGVVVTGPAEEYDEPVDLDEFDDDFADDLAELFDTLDEESANELVSVGIINLEQQLKALPRDLTAAETDDLRDTLQEAVAARVAASAEREVLAGARDVQALLRRGDERVLAFARVSGTGNPCDFCALLISRGAVYRTAWSAGSSSGKGRGKNPRGRGEEFHTNCKCTVEEIYSDEQFQLDDRFDLSRELQEFYTTVKKSDERNVLAAWRKAYRARQKAQAA